MGEAKRRAQGTEGLVWHHTSILRTNQLWMSGYLLPEGEMKPVHHPQLGEVGTNAVYRRPMKDFAPLVWFTSEVSVPQCLQKGSIVLVAKDGTHQQIDITPEIMNGMSLHRVALGFRPDGIGVQPWREHPGYATAEGRELNETARDAGDDPDAWFVSETKVDLLACCAFRQAKSLNDLKMVPRDAYVADMHRMVRMCREKPGVYIPPSWVSEKDARLLAARLGLPAQMAG